MKIPDTKSRNLDVLKLVFFDMHRAGTVTKLQIPIWFLGLIVLSKKKPKKKKNRKIYFHNRFTVPPFFFFVGRSAFINSSLITNLLKAVSGMIYLYGRGTWLHSCYTLELVSSNSFLPDWELYSFFYLQLKNQTKE